MTSSKGNFAPLRFSTDDLPERERIAYVREVYGRVIVKHEIEPCRDSPFYWRGVVRLLPGLGLATMEVSGIHTQRTRSQIDSDDLVLNVTLAGKRVVRQLGREAVVGAGEIAVTRSADAGQCAIESGSQCLGVRVPLNAIRHMIADLDSVLVRTITNVVAPTALLLNSAEFLQESETLGGAEVWKLAISHVYDLVALTLGATREAAEIAKGRGLRVARLRAAKADIIENMGRRDLSLSAVAKRQGISPNSFAKNRSMVKAPTSPNSCWGSVWHARTGCSAMRASPRMRSVRSPDEAGFGDLSYFNHAFRRRYGLTPSDVRESWRHGER